MPSEKRVLILKGLDCASCSNKIESEVKKIDGVISASINFVSSKLELDIDESKDIKTMLDEVTRKIKKIEPEVTIISPNE